MSRFRFEHRAEVRFRDLDPMGHAHHSLPLIYFEEARAAYWRDVVGRSGADEIDYILAEATLGFHARILFPQRVTILVRVSRIGSSSFDMEYQLRSADDELLADGRTVQVMYDYAAGRPKQIPAEIRARMEEYDAPA